MPPRRRWRDPTSVMAGSDVGRSARLSMKVEIEGPQKMAKNDMKKNKERNKTRKNGKFIQGMMKKERRMHEGAEAPKKEKKRNRKEMQNDGQGCGFGCVFWWLRRLVWFCSVGRVDCFSWTCTSCDPTVFKLSLNGSWHGECAMA